MIEMLVVDDEEKIREGIARGIPWERHGVTVCATAASGVEALGLIEQLLPDIVLLDLRMPDLDGLELLEIVRERYPSICCIIVSGLDDFASARRAVELHAFGYLLKPVEESELVAKVSEARAEIERRLAEVDRDEELRQRFREAMPVLRDSFLAELAAGNVADETTARERASFLGVPLQGSRCLALAMSMEAPARQGAWPASAETFSAFALRGRAERLLREIHPSSYSFSCAGELGALVCADTLDRPRVLAACRALKVWANTSLGVSLSVGVGRVHAGLAGAAASVRDARQALDYRVTRGRNEVIDADSLGEAGRLLLDRHGFEHLLRRLDAEALAAVRSGNRDRLAAIAGEVAQRFVEHAEADIARKDRLAWLGAFFLARLAFSLELFGEPLDTGVELATELAKPHTAAELTGVIRGHLERLLTAWQEEQAGANGFLARKAREIVQASLYGDSSLSAVAAALDVHPCHLSRAFKQETGSAFIEYVTATRMREASALLKQTNRRVHEIAEALGYRDVNHFARVFRRVVGVSPSEYRQIP